MKAGLSNPLFSFIFFADLKSKGCIEEMAFREKSSFH